MIHKHKGDMPGNSGLRSMLCTMRFIASEVLVGHVPFCIHFSSSSFPVSMVAGIIISVHDAVFVHVACQVAPAAVALVGSIVIAHLGGKLRASSLFPCSQPRCLYNLSSGNTRTKKPLQLEHLLFLPMSTMRLKLQLQTPHSLQNSAKTMSTYTNSILDLLPSITSSPFSPPRPSCKSSLLH